MSSRSSSPTPSGEFQNARSASQPSSDDDGGDEYDERDHTSTDPSSISSGDRKDKEQQEPKPRQGQEEEQQQQSQQQEQQPKENAEQKKTTKNDDDDEYQENPPITIPKIQPITPPPSSASHEPPAVLARGLEGKFVDEFGNVLGWDGTVLGRAEGDLPSLIGRPVDYDGRIRDTDGHVAGYVSENFSRPPVKELGCGLTLDADGSIHDESGAVVGRINPGGASAAGAGGQRSGGGGEKGRGQEQQQQQKPSTSQSQPQGQSQPPPQAHPTHHETQFNIPYRSASDHPSPMPAAPSPSEIYLDVKSTRDGIQLIIKIPTIFNRDSQSQPPG